jgi:hypothetical protein
MASGKCKELKENMSLLQTVLESGPSHPVRMAGYGGGSFIFGAVSAVSMLIITVGVFYVLMKLGRFIDAMKEKTDAGSAKE